jgi:hypothetical protein
MMLRLRRQVGKIMRREQGAFAAFSPLPHRKGKHAFNVA